MSASLQMMMSDPEEPRCLVAEAIHAIWCEKDCGHCPEPDDFECADVALAALVTAGLLPDFRVLAISQERGKGRELLRPAGRGSTKGPDRTRDG